MKRSSGAELRSQSVRVESEEGEGTAIFRVALPVGEVDRTGIGSDAVALWTIDEVSAYLRVPVGTLYQWRVRGEGPPALRLGSRHLRFSPESVRAWALAQPGA